MINIVYSEFLKLKRTYLLFLVILAGIFIPGMMYFSGTYADNVQNIDKTSCLNAISNINIFQFEILDIIIFSIICGYVFSREYTNMTAGSLYSYPVSKFKIIIGKFIIILSLIFIVYIINFISTIMFILRIFGTLFIEEVVYMQLKTIVISFLLQIILIPLPSLIACISKNIIIPTVYGIIAAIVSFFMSISEIYMQLCPFLLPSLPYYYFYRKDTIDNIAVLLSGTLIFLIPIIIFIYYLMKTDIN